MKDNRNQNNNYQVVSDDVYPPSDDEARDDIENTNTSQQTFKRLKNSLFFTSPNENLKPASSSSPVAMENGQKDLTQQTSNP